MNEWLYNNVCVYIIIYLDLTAVGCGPPPSITNGSPGTPTSTTFGGTVTYNCTNGYETPSGMSMTTVSCLASGMWDTVNCTGTFY